MDRVRPSFALAVLLFLPASLAAQRAGKLAWDARTAEHLWNRAGFGAPPSEIERAVALGREAFVAELLAGPSEVEEPFYPRADRSELRERMRELTPEERKREVGRMRDDEEATLRDYLAWWVERMVRGEDPLLECMTLFWHGHFTSSMSDVKNAREMIAQNRLFRRHALGSFRELLHAIARDAAMLEYLDNDVNRRESPNENFARELMELFTLGEGNYSEQDVKEAARAFTGWRHEDGEFRVVRRAHDDGEKTVLGRTGRLDGDDVLELLLEQEACPRFLAGKLLFHFEGAEPEAERLERYARLLRANDYAIRPFLEALFLDPEFYRPEVLGTRITAPLDFLVGTTRRLGIDPPPRSLVFGAGVLGQKLFFPPNVKGWESGEAWITTASLMQRGNLAGFLLGEVSLRDFLDEETSGLEDSGPPAQAMAGEAGMEGGTGAGEDAALPRKRRSEGFGELRSLERLGWRPRFHLSERLRRAGVSGDEGVVDALAGMLLGGDLEPDTRRSLVRYLGEERAKAGVSGTDWLDDSNGSEPILRRLAHLILSLPEGQLD